MGNPFVKQYRKRGELTILLAIDISEADFGSGNRSKRERMAELDLLAFSAVHNGDKVGLFIIHMEELKHISLLQKAKSMFFVF